MPTSRLKLRPLSPWRTPWQADTLTGMLMAVCARVHGPEVLRDLIMDPMLDGNPPFVLSDACPGDLLPIPVWLRLADWPDADRKRLKRARWLQPGDFHRARRGEMPAADALIPEDQVFREDTRQHNTLDRLSNTTGEAESGLGIFSRPETRLRAAASAENGGDYLSVYFRILEPGAEELLVELFDELALPASAPTPRRAVGSSKSSASRKLFPYRMSRPRAPIRSSRSQPFSPVATIPSTASGGVSEVRQARPRLRPAGPRGSKEHAYPVPAGSLFPQPKRLPATFPWPRRPDE